MAEKKSSIDDPLEVDFQYGILCRRRWVPAPRYLLRRHRILNFLRKKRPGQLLEIGCGAGSLLFDFCKLGYTCQGLDSSPAAVNMAGHLLRDIDNAAVSSEPHSDWHGQFDYLVSCEVLEHIEDDLSTLRSWLNWVRPGGQVILSMPAHMSMWGTSDVWAGHFRRYSRNDLETLARDAGLRLLKVECYGFPLANVTRRLRNHRSRHTKYDLSDAERAANTAKSGVDRPTEIKLYHLQASWPGRLIMSAACQMQRPFWRTNFGEGFLMFAQKR